ncbi:isopentenyl transferase family protein [Lacticaseibacillus daqingensis]|uniref:isopentenyl transferase family protein n=1 Tax=Lacticaseibacillus daqingensis TaxID=2486014 RepID=UPI0013DD9758|nr:isopentenyl transferase family protein [Lacticaseibacillus daqingensis]
MRIMLIGNAGTGKSTFARAVAAQTGWPLLALDRVWHTMDYSHAAKLKFAQTQRQFMAAHADWLIDGNYGGTMALRLAQADLVVVMTCPRVVALLRVVRRSLMFRRDPRSRPDMAPGFVEHFDADYWAFLRYVWAYPVRYRATIAPKLRTMRSNQRVVVVRTRRQKQALLRALTSR